jgi:hypothetical protein
MWEAVSLKQEIIIGITSLLLVAYSGNGELNFQTYDHVKHNFVFADLVKYKWPVYYNINGEHLNYYLGYYLIPSIFGKMIGVNVVAWVNLILLSCLFYLCLSYIIGKYDWSWLKVLFFLFFSASTFWVVFLRLIINKNVPINELFDGVYALWTGPAGRYPQIPIYESLKWVPQHFISALAFFVFWIESKKNMTPLLLPVSMFLSFWSVYVGISVGLFILLNFNNKFKSSFNPFKTPNLLTLIPFSVIGLYFSAHTSGVRNDRNFEYFNIEYYINLISSILSFSLPLLIFVLLLYFSFPKRLTRAFLIYLIGAALLALSADFDLFARGTILFQMNLILTCLTLPVDRMIKCRDSFVKLSCLSLVFILFSLPGVIVSIGPPLYYILNKGLIPKPIFTVKTALDKYQSIKQHDCAYFDLVKLNGEEKNECNENYLRYSGNYLFILK